MSLHKQPSMNRTTTQSALVIEYIKALLSKKADLIRAHQNVMANFTDKESQFAIETRANYERLLDEEEELLRIYNKLSA